MSRLQYSPASAWTRLLRRVIFSCTGSLRPSLPRRPGLLRRFLPRAHSKVLTFPLLSSLPAFVASFLCPSRFHPAFGASSALPPLKDFSLRGSYWRRSIFVLPAGSCAAPNLFCDCLSESSRSELIHHCFWFLIW
jgi:hypothetical protein